MSLATAVARSEVGTGSSALLEVMLLRSELEVECCDKHLGNVSSISLLRLRGICGTFCGKRWGKGGVCGEVWLFCFDNGSLCLNEGCDVVLSSGRVTRKVTLGTPS